MWPNGSDRIEGSDRLQLLLVVWHAEWVGESEAMARPFQTIEAQYH